jgi:hypothetical protein
VFDSVAYRDTESEQNDLADREKRSAENDIAYWPSVFKSAEDKDELRDDVYDGADQRPENVYNPQSDRLVVLESSKLFESGDREEERDAEQE